MNCDKAPLASIRSNLKHSHRTENTLTSYFIVITIHEKRLTKMNLTPYFSANRNRHAHIVFNAIAH